MAFYGERSERLFCEQLDYNLLFRRSLTWTARTQLAAHVFAAACDLFANWMPT